MATSESFAVSGPLWSWEAFFLHHLFREYTLQSVIGPSCKWAIGLSGRGNNDVMGVQLAGPSSVGALSCWSRGFLKVGDICPQASTFICSEQFPLSRILSLPPTCVPFPEVCTLPFLCENCLPAWVSTQHLGSTPWWLSAGPSGLVSGFVQ